eukprot:CAMPEP_0171306500 /NCGR_PEP_ID=MMETSP0816-20121228/16523_1 /TAXON_ID=420281 /ORGANISM="Proboscia inermis, Strain CCAP1064/1" /LENGTH=256 /DNA_ID=CAMNT_0011788119 /DNA_START=39 /DNA_END=809 /DNA_ORIENTATION=+
MKSEQWTNVRENMFFQRILFDYSTVSSTDKECIEHAISNRVQKELNMNCELSWRTRKQRVAIMVSKYDHCLWELLLRYRSGELHCDIPVVLSNHPNLKPVCDTFGIPFEVFPITHENKLQQEHREIELLKGKHEVDMVVLARYMQVKTQGFLNEFPNRILNIHHSFLPAFTGAKPYRAAHDRGVKLIGATAHYATDDLDEGPIIEQDVIRVSHRDDIESLQLKGQILERNVLVRALEAHLDERVILHNTKCVVFGD